MQNTELYRRGVVLPLDNDAEEALRSNEVDEATNVRLLEIADEVQFEALWRLGLFKEINARCATMIDDYEQEIVEAASVERILAAIDAVARDAVIKHPEMAEFLEDLRDLARQAALSSRPLLFVL